MANEVTVTITLAVSKNGVQDRATISFQEDMTGNAIIHNVQTIGGTSEAILLGDVATIGNIAFRNANKKYADLSDTEKAGYSSKEDYTEKNTVYISETNPATDSNAQIVLKPQQGAYPRPQVNAYYAIKDTDDVKLEVLAVEQ